MAIKKEDKRLLDCWIPPANAGLAKGCLATTYTFQSDFFEEECLTRFLSIESKADEDGPVYLIEREEKLNNISCAAVWVDQAFARQKRNLRWDLVPVRLQHSILHSKICVLQWTNCVRVILGSSNLTVPAYRKNQEVFSVIDLSRDITTDKSLAKKLIEHLVKIIQADSFINVTIKEKHSGFLNNVISFIDSLPEEFLNIRKTGYLSFPVLIEPGNATFKDQVSEIWRQHVSPTAPSDCFITSPFFDQSVEKNVPAIRLWEMMKRKGRVSVHIYTTGEYDNDGNPVRINAPENINQTQPKNRADTEILWHIIPQIEGEDLYYRPLHMKTYWFENESGWKLLVMGSSNFTSKGWGLVSQSNYEANIAYLTNADQYPDQFKEMLKTFKDVESVDTDNIKWDPVKSEDETSIDSIEIPLPPFFQSATLIRDEYLFIEIKFSTNSPCSKFSLRDDEGIVYLDDNQWAEAGSPTSFRIRVDNKKIPPYFLVFLDNKAEPACLTINIISQQCLPPPEELRNLPLDVLTQIITSATPLHQALKRYLEKIARKETVHQELINPHDRVDTSTFLLQKTRKYSFAINTVRLRLQQPYATAASLDWRLTGPVGLQALVEAFENEAQNNLSEAIFFLTELWTQLGNINPVIGEGILGPEIVMEKINEFRKLLATRISGMWGKSEILSIDNYSRKVLQNGRT